MTKRLIRLLKLQSFSFVVFLVPTFLFAAIPQASPTGYVNDFAQILSVEQKNALENKLTLFNASTSNEIAVVTVKSLDGDYIEHYAVELFKAWGIGTKKNNNGVLLLIAVDDHKMRIEVGYGLEGALTDSISAQIIRDDLTPAFKQNDFYGGIDRATDDIIKVTKGEYVASVATNSSNSLPSLSKNFTEVAILLLFGAVQVLSFISSLFARSKSWWAGGVVGGILGGVATVYGFLGLTFVSGGILTVVFVILGLLFDYIVSNRYTHAVSSGSSIPWWIGGRGFGGGGGSSFGGFSGGSSGGGGASGRW
jgi:uncharacterized protein